MSQNPYASEGESFGGQPYQADFDEPTRTSVLAILSLVCSLICCIPALPLLGIVFGAISLATISGSQGRVTGRGAALAGIIIGLAVSVLQGAIFAGAATGVNFYRNEMAPAGYAFFENLDAGDVSEARKSLTPGADQALSDEQLRTFFETTERLCGDVAPQQGGRTFWLDLQFIGAAFQASQEQLENQQGPQVGDDVAPVPIAIESDAGAILVYAFLAPDDQPPPGPTAVLDILVYVPDSNEAITLRPDGPARRVAIGSGIPDENLYLAGQTPEGAAEQPAEEPPAEQPPAQPEQTGDAR